MTMNGENWLLVTDEPVDFENTPVEVSDLRKITQVNQLTLRIRWWKFQTSEKLPRWTGWLWEYTGASSRLQDSPHRKGNYGIYPNSLKRNQEIQHCNRVDLGTLGSRPIMPKNLPRHCGTAAHITGGSQASTGYAAIKKLLGTWVHYRNLLHWHIVYVP
jgi:hypothetical protein